MGYTARNIADWFIQRAIKDVNECGGEYITHLKLQKLLYFAQGCYCVMKKQPLFPEKIYAWAHGPVVADLYSEFKSYGDKGITKFRSVKIDCGTEAILEEVYRVFGQYSAWALREITHQQEPWVKTKRNEEIPLKLIQDYFRREIVVE